MFTFQKIFYFFIAERTNIRRRSRHRNKISLSCPKEKDNLKANTGKKVINLMFFKRSF